MNLIPAPRLRQYLGRRLQDVVTIQKQQITMNLVISRLQTQRLAVSGFRRRKISHYPQHLGHIVIGIGIFRIARDCALISSDRLMVQTKIFITATQTVIRPRIVRFNFQRLLVRLQRPRMISELT